MPYRINQSQKHKINRNSSSAFSKLQLRSLSSCLFWLFYGSFPLQFHSALLDTRCNISPIKFRAIKIGHRIENTLKQGCCSWIREVMCWRVVTLNSSVCREKLGRFLPDVLSLLLPIRAHLSSKILVTV